MKIELPDLYAHTIRGRGTETAKRYKMIYRVCKREIYEVMDVCKVADVLILAMSCKDAQLEKLKDDPDQFANAIDEKGYKFLDVIRAQGVPPSIGVLQHIETVPMKKRNEVKKLF